jgi:hypothetical protein
LKIPRLLRAAWNDDLLSELSTAKINLSQGAKIAKESLAFLRGFASARDIQRAQFYGAA